MNRKITVALGSAVSAAVLASCSQLTVDKLEVGARQRDGYEIILEFANVLNLTDHARVVMDGTTVGQVDRIELTREGVDVTVRLNDGVRVPASTRAELQQPTVLGDIFVALNRIDKPAAALPPNSRVPLTQTVSPPQLEDTIAKLANFVASGSIQRFQDTMMGINRVTADHDADLPQITRQVSRDLADLSDNIASVDLMLAGLADTSTVLHRGIPTIRFSFTRDGLTAWDRVTEASSAISTTLPSIGSIYTGGFWMVPALESIGVAIGAVQQTKWAAEGEYPAWRKLFTDMFLPEDKYPAMNITSVVAPDGRDITDKTHDVLRILGAMP
jgi:phospholipid/cholesterol/gamma-HCH transport system substrate-binding protein